jgi:hypothetical protein
MLPVLCCDSISRLRRLELPNKLAKWHHHDEANFGPIGVTHSPLSELKPNCARVNCECVSPDRDIGVTTGDKRRDFDVFAWYQDVTQHSTLLPTHL